VGSSISQLLIKLLNNDRELPSLILASECYYSV
jgi:hypothetical protein